MFAVYVRHMGPPGVEITTLELFFNFF